MYEIFIKETASMRIGEIVSCCVATCIVRVGYCQSAFDMICAVNCKHSTISIEHCISIETYPFGGTTEANSTEATEASNIT